MPFHPAPSARRKGASNPGATMQPVSMFYEKFDPEATDIPSTYAGLSAYYEKYEVKEANEWNKKCMFLLGTLKDTNRIVIAMPEDQAGAVVAPIATPFVIKEAGFIGKSGLGIAPERDLTDMHKVDGFVPTAQISDWSLINLVDNYKQYEEDPVYLYLVVSTHMRRLCAGHDADVVYASDAL